MNKSQQIKRANPLSEQRKKILAQQIEIEKNKIPSHVISMINKSKFPEYKMGEKFKNMQDPLAYIQTKKIQQLKNDALSASKSLHEEMNEIFEVSKHSYKQVITPEINRYDFQQLSIRRFNNDSTLSDKGFYQQIKARSQKLKKQKYDPTDYMERIRHLNYPLKDLSNLLAKENQFFYGKKYEIKNQDDESQEEIPLTFQHIKQLKSSGFGKQFQNIEFYEYLCSQPKKYELPYVSQFDISSNRRINHPIIDLKFKLIDRSQQFSSKSKQLYYDFDNDLSFWKNDSHKQWRQQNNKKFNEQEIVRLHMNMDISRLGANYMLKFASKKITPWGIAEYKKLKRGHKRLEREIEQETEGLAQQYQKMREQYKLLKLARRAQRSAPPIKYVHSQAQTIYTLPDQEFDNYFKDETIEILNKLNKLDSLRQKALKNYNSQHPDDNKLIMVQNICQDIKYLLFHILMMMLKDEKFYDHQGFPLFGYGDLVQMEDIVETQSKVLKFILHNIDKFEIQQVDNVPKSKLIKIYIEERTKNNRILEIIHAK